MTSLRLITYLSLIETSLPRTRNFVGSRSICPTLAVPRFQLSLVSTNARANPESGPKLPIVSLRLPTARQKIDQGWSLEALNWDNYVAHVQFPISAVSARNLNPIGMRGASHGKHPNEDC